MAGVAAGDFRPTSTPSGPSSSSASRSTAPSRCGPASRTPSRRRRRPTRSATSSAADWGPDVHFDLWLPTANPMTTPELLDAVAEGAEARGIGTIWVGEHVVLFDEYASRYPYAEDGRIPAPPGQRAARAADHPLLPGGPHLDGAARDRHAAPPPAQPGLRGQGGRDARLALGRPGRPGRRRRVAEGGVRRAQRAVGAPGPAHRRVPRGAAHAVGRRPVLVPRRALRPARLRDVPQARPAAPPADPRRRRDRRRPAPGGPRRPGLAHLQPLARGAGGRAWPTSTRTSKRRGAAGPTCASPSAPTSSS